MVVVGAGLLFAGAMPLAQAAGGVASSLFADALGSVRDLTDGDEALSGAASYNPFGTPAATTGQTPALGYTGAFTTPDTFIPNAPGTSGFNAYAYTADNPETLTDLTGHEGTLGEEGAARHRRRTRFDQRQRRVEHPRASKVAAEPQQRVSARCGVQRVRKHAGRWRRCRRDNRHPVLPG